MPAKRVIILDRQLSAEAFQGQGADIQFRYVFWADVPVGRQSFYARTTGSEWSGATSLEHDAIKAGAVAERVGIIRVIGGTSIGQIQNRLESLWTDYQNEISAFNPWNRYGSHWTGVTWVAAGAT